MLKRLARGEKGFGLIEALVSIAILGIIAAAFLGALVTTSRAVLISDERTTAEALAKSQMESIKAQDYDEAGVYPLLTDIEEIQEDYPTFSISMVTAQLYTGLQKVTIDIFNDTDKLFTLEGYKVDREL